MALLLLCRDSEEGWLTFSSWDHAPLSDGNSKIYPHREEEYENHKQQYVLAPEESLGLSIKGYTLKEWAVA